MTLIVEIHFNSDGTSLYTQALGALREAIQRQCPRGEAFAEFAPKVHHGGTVRDTKGIEVGKWRVIES